MHWFVRYLQPARNSVCPLSRTMSDFPEAERVSQIAHFAGAQADARSGGAIICDAAGASISSVCKSDKGLLYLSKAWHNLCNNTCGPSRLREATMYHQHRPCTPHNMQVHPSATAGLAVVAAGWAALGLHSRLLGGCCCVAQRSRALSARLYPGQGVQSGLFCSSNQA